MEPLRQQDLRATLQFLENVYAATDVDAFESCVTRELSTIVPCELASYAELNKKRLRLNWVWHGAEPFADAQQIFVAHRHENPVVMHNAITPNSPPVKTTDFISLREFRRRGIYSEFYGALRLDYMMTAKLPSNPQMQVAVAVLRSGRDFSERERRMLTIMQPHLLQAYRNAEFRGDHRCQLGLLRQAAAEIGLGLIELTASGAIRRTTPQAHAWLAEYFPASNASGPSLPEPLDAWVRKHALPSDTAAAVPAPRGPLVIDRDDRRLVARLIAERGVRFIALEEQSSRPAAANLRSLGLTPRETEVLAWVAAGKTNAVIATILDLSPRTVQHTLERVFAKLGVETRVAAAACAFRAGLEPPRPG